jgi:hypothetical protein
MLHVFSKNQVKLVVRRQINRDKEYIKRTKRRKRAENCGAIAHPCTARQIPALRARTSDFLRGSSLHTPQVGSPVTVRSQEACARQKYHRDHCCQSNKSTN